VNLRVTSSAVGVLRVLVVLRASRFTRSHVVGHAVASQTQLVNGAVLQQACVRRPVRHMTGRASFGFHRSVFVRKRPLLIYVALDAGRVGAGREPGLLQLETTMRIVAIAATHCAFQHLVMERRGKLRFDFTVATRAELRIVHLQHSHG